MPTQINFNGGKSRDYKTASPNTAPATKAQTNFDGKRPSGKCGNAKSPQMNFDVSVAVKNGEGKSQGQKAGTGCNNGY